jgi:hypothetical protein
VATCGRILLFVHGVESGDVSYLWEVKYKGLVVSVFRGVGGDLFIIVVECVVVFGSLKSQWSMAVLADICVYVTRGYMLQS